MYLFKKTSLKKLLKHLLSLLIVMVLLVFGVGYFLLNTESGLKQSISFANRYSGYQISVDKIQGRLWQKTELQGVTIVGDAFEIRSGSLTFDWQPKQLWDYRIDINSVTLNDTVISIANKDSLDENPASSTGLPDIDLPIDVKIEDISINNLTINNPATQQPIFKIDSFDLGIDFIKQQGNIHTLHLVNGEIDLNMKGYFITKGDYPIALTNTTQYASSAYGNQIVDAKIDGNLKKNLKLSINGHGLSDFSLQASVGDLFTNPNFKADFALAKFEAKRFNLIDTAASANLVVEGRYDTSAKALTMQSSGSIFYVSPETDKVRFAFDASIDKEKVILSALSLDLITAKQQLLGSGEYVIADDTLDFTFNSAELSWPQTEPKLAKVVVQKNDVVVNDLLVTVKGKLAGYKVNVNAKTQTLIAGEVPIVLSAEGGTQAIKALQATMKISGQPLVISGKASWANALSYDLRIAADDIAPLNDIPGLKAVLINVKGNDDSYQASGALHIYSNTIAPTDITLAASGTPTNLQQAKLVLDTLGGTITAQASGNLIPLDLNADLLLSTIQPQKFYQSVNANIDAHIVTHVKQTNGNLSAMTEIKQLKGTLQQQPLSGTGKVTFDQASQVLDIHKLNLNLAGNLINANGRLSTDATGGQSNLSANIDAKYLNKLLPQLSGYLQANILAKGNVKQPEITASLKGSGIKYQQQKIAKLAADMVISLAKDKVDLTADATDANVAGNKIGSAKISMQGKLSAHTLNVNVETPKKGSIPSVKLAATGGLDVDNMAWSGKLHQLILDSVFAGAWRLPRASELTLSAENITVKQFCLQQFQDSLSASLCANGQLENQKGQFFIKLNNLSSESFSQYFPKTLKIKATLGGHATINMVNGNPEVKGKIAAKGGQLQLVTGSGGLDSKIKVFSTDFALKNNRAEAIVSASLSKVGDIKITAAVPNVNQRNIRANLKIKSDNLRFVEELVPQLSDVKGGLSGDMTISGDPNKRLKVAGKVTLANTAFNVPQYGTEIEQLQLDIFAQNGNAIGFRGGAEAGKGKFKIDGHLNPTTKKGQISISGSNFQVANSKKLQVAISPDLKITFGDNVKIRGDILIAKALIVPEMNSSKVTASEDVVMPHAKKRKKAASSSPVDAIITIKLGNDVRVSSNDVSTRLSGAIKIIAEPKQALAASGNVRVQTGEIRVYGQLLNIERGRVIFSGPVKNPSLDVRTSREIDDVIVGASLLGSVQRPKISLFSTPSMSDSSILSYLLFGHAPDSASFGTAALSQAGGMLGTNMLANNLKSSVGLDVLNLSIAGMEAGKNLSKELYVGMKSDFFKEMNDFLLKYKFNNSLRVDASLRGGGSVSLDLIKVIETD